MSAPPPRLRFPRWGSLAYELFDNAAFLFILATVGYLLSTPPTTQRDALALVYEVAPAWAWGAGLALAAGTSMLCSCHPRWVRRGMVLLQSTCVFWASCFAVGTVIYAFTYAPPITWVAGLFAMATVALALCLRRKPITRSLLVSSEVGALVMFAWAGFYEPSIVRVVISITLYFWIASRLTRDLARWDLEYAARTAAAR